MKNWFETGCWETALKIWPNPFVKYGILFFVMVTNHKSENQWMFALSPRWLPPNRVEKTREQYPLIPVLFKDLEGHIRNFTMGIADILDRYQFGSIAASSTVHALIEPCKAFDHVVHQILLTKLVNYGLPDFLVKRMTAFLTNR